MMMKISAAAAGALLIACAGCYSTDLARPPVSQEEKAWEDIIRESYPGYKAPPKTSRTVKGHTESRVSVVIAKEEAKPAEDPAEKKEESAAPQELPAAEKAAEVKEEKAAEAAPAEAKEEKAVEAAPAEAKAEKAAEAKEEKAAEAAPAEVKAEKAAEAKEEKAAAEKPAEAQSSAVMPPDPTNSSVYVVKSGDTLGGIAQKNYGNAGYSNIIYKANSDILKDPNKLRPGMKLIIPKL
ncbi:MAG: LysM peptidoglycan-binding domain-containing protein [Lentisphaeria bacterium]|nr:LysM peptidoglycan-binding domain-containing protein [Lentisphaeria bacterium]